MAVFFALEQFQSRLVDLVRPLLLPPQRNVLPRVKEVVFDAQANHDDGVRRAKERCVKRSFRF